MSWLHKEFQQLCKITRGASPRPIQNWMTERQDGIPWIKISDATSSGGRTIERTAGRILREGEEKSVSVHKGDLILSNSATPGIPKFVGIHACIHDGWLLLREFKDSMPEFLFYLLQHERRNLVAQGNGSVFTNLKTDILKSHQVSVPPLAEQKAIVHILGTLDDKIELNQKISQNLEEIANAIFKSWFVDFDPVRAKAEGHPTGLPPEISDLFPDELVDSEIGEIPKGWKLKPLYELGQFINGAAYKKFEPNKNGKGLPVIKIAELKLGITEQTGFSEVLMEEKYKIKKRDILFSWSGNPDTSIDTFVWHREDAWLNQHIFKVVPHDGVPRAFLLQLLRSKKPVFMEIARNKQTTGLGHVTVKDLKEIQVALPSRNRWEEATRLLNSLHERVFIANQEVLCLSDLRDTLLPKLISGELRIPDAEKFLEEAGV